MDAANEGKAGLTQEVNPKTGVQTTKPKPHGQNAPLSSWVSRLAALNTFPFPVLGGSNCLLSGEFLPVIDSFGSAFICVDLRLNGPFQDYRAGPTQ